VTNLFDGTKREFVSNLHLSGGQRHIESEFQETFHD